MASGSIAVPITSEPRGVERTQLRMALERFRAHRPAMAGALVLTLLAILCAAAPLVSPYDPDKTALLSL